MCHRHKYLQHFLYLFQSKSTIIVTYLQDQQMHGFLPTFIRGNTVIMTSNSRRHLNHHDSKPDSDLEIRSQPSNSHLKEGKNQSQNLLALSGPVRSCQVLTKISVEVHTHTCTALSGSVHVEDVGFSQGLGDSGASHRLSTVTSLILHVFFYVTPDSALRGLPSCVNANITFSSLKKETGCALSWRDHNCWSFFPLLARPV